MKLRIHGAVSQVRYVYELCQSSGGECINKPTVAKCNTNVKHWYFTYFYLKIWYIKSQVALLHIWNSCIKLQMKLREVWQIAFCDVTWLNVSWLLQLWA